MQMLREAKEAGSAGEKGLWGPKVDHSKGPFVEPNGCEANAGVSQLWVCQQKTNHISHASPLVSTTLKFI